jgi:flagella basal body P-ring formation protein FlgA
MIGAIIMLMSAAATPSVDMCFFARQELLRAVSGREGLFTVTANSPSCSAAVLSSGATLSARAAADRIRPRMVVWVDVTANGRLQKSVPIAFDVHWLRTALVSREQMSAKISLSADRFEIKEVDVAAIQGEPVTLEQLSGMRLRREMRPGAVLTSDAMEHEPDVTAGEKIDVYAATGRVVVRTVGVAERDGYSGDRINARLVKANQSIRVRVIGKNRTQVIDSASAF